MAAETLKNLALTVSTYEKENIQYKKDISKLTSDNVILHNKCKELANKCMNLESEIKKLNKDHEDRKQNARIGLAVMKYLNSKDKLNNMITEFFSTMSLLSDIGQYKVCTNCGFESDDDESY